MAEPREPVMKTLPGTIIQPGLFIGSARIIIAKSYQIPRLQIDSAEIEAELESLQTAIGKAENDLVRLLEQEAVAGQDRQILQTHLMILKDPEIMDQVQNAIRSKLHSAAHAVKTSFESIIRQFQELENDFFAQRASDYQDVSHRLLTAILGETEEDISDWQPEQIAILRDITPSQVTGFSRIGVKAYCTEHGSYTSHASILSRAMGITALTALPDISREIATGTTLIVDAMDGTLIIDPDPATLAHYEQHLAKYRQDLLALRETGSKPAVTLSGRQIKLRLNLELASEIPRIKELGARGVGLFRTEFLYLGKDRLPPEEEQYQVYREIAEQAAPHSVTIRTFDLGGDKLSHLIPSPAEENPYLGCRGIRFSLAHEEIFKTQVRAILRAGTQGKVKLMFPMVMDVLDFLKAREVVRICQTELETEGISIAKHIPLGVMIEVPSAALCAAELARVCDFFSIGTNDLVQYTLAADRNNDGLSPYYLSHHPAVLQLIRLSLKAARKYKKPVSVCGEMASIAEYIPLLVGMGINELSVNPGQYYTTKAIIRRCDDQLESLVKNLDFSGSLSEVESLIYQKLKPYYHS